MFVLVLYAQQERISSLVPHCGEIVLLKELWVQLGRRQSNPQRGYLKTAQMCGVYSYSSIPSSHICARVLPKEPD